MHLLDLDSLPDGLSRGLADLDEIHRVRSLLSALCVALLPVGMRVVCMGRVGLVAGWTTPPEGGAKIPFFAATEPFQSGPGSVSPFTGFTTRSNTYLPALRAQVIVDVATLPHLCKVIAESFGYAPKVGESFGIARHEGTGRAGVPGFRWTLRSTHGAAWDLDLSHETAEEAVIACARERAEDIATAYAGREPDHIR